MPKNSFTCFFFIRMGQLDMLSSLERSILTSQPLITCTENMVFLIWKLLLSRFTTSPCSTQCCTTVSTMAWPTASVLPSQITISSKYPIHYFMYLKIVSIITWNDGGALVRLNGNLVYWKRPCIARKAFFHLSPSVILIRLCLFFSVQPCKPLSASSLVK